MCHLAITPINQRNEEERTGVWRCSVTQIARLYTNGCYLGTRVRRYNVQSNLRHKLLDVISKQFLTPVLISYH